jgi:hypothetical protein
VADPEIVEWALAGWQAHVFSGTTTCVCGYPPTTAPDWDRHRMDAAIDSVADWLAGRASSTLTADPFRLAADWAADRMRGGGSG